MSTKIITALKDYYGSMYDKSKIGGEVRKGLKQQLDIFVELKNKARNDAKKLLSNYTITDIPEGLGNFRAEDQEMITQQFAKWKELQDEAIKNGNDAEAVRIFELSQKAIDSINEITSYKNEHKTNLDIAGDGTDITAYSKISNEHYLDFLITGNFKAKFDVSGELEFHFPTGGGDNQITWTDAMDWSDIDNQIILKDTDNANEIIEKITQVSTSKIYDTDRNRVIGLLANKLESDETILSFFNDDVFMFTDGNQPVTIKDLYKEENPKFNFDAWDPKSKMWQDMKPTEKREALNTMRAYITDKIMSYSDMVQEQVEEANKSAIPTDTKVYYGQTKLQAYGGSTSVKLQVLEVGSGNRIEVSANPRAINNAMAMMDNPVAGQTEFTAWDGRTYRFVQVSGKKQWQYKTPGASWKAIDSVKTMSQMLGVDMEGYVPKFDPYKI